MERGVNPCFWHSNPAWVLYDLLDNPRYGMRRYALTLNIYTQDFTRLESIATMGSVITSGTGMKTLHHEHHLSRKPKQVGNFTELSWSF